MISPRCRLRNAPCEIEEGLAQLALGCRNLVSWETAPLQRVHPILDPCHQPIEELTAMRLVGLRPWVYGETN